jgi:hypothetical protein
MISLDEAWKWYESSRQQYRLVQRLAEKYWEDLPWDKKLERDERFKEVNQNELFNSASFALEHLDDLAVLVLFSVFESLVRERLVDELRIESGTIRHPVLRRASEEAIQRTEEGSFYRVFEAFKVKNDAVNDLIEEVNQVRHYRNWVAHGRRGKQPESVPPKIARDRLDRFLTLLEDQARQVADSATAGDAEIAAD